MMRDTQSKGVREMKTFSQMVNDGVELAKSLRNNENYSSSVPNNSQCVGWAVSKKAAKRLLKQDGAIIRPSLWRPLADAIYQLI
jgi:hypothetical protein